MEDQKNLGHRQGLARLRKVSRSGPLPKSLSHKGGTALGCIPPEPSRRRLAECRWLTKGLLRSLRRTPAIMHKGLYIKKVTNKGGGARS